MVAKWEPGKVYKYLEREVPNIRNRAVAKPIIETLKESQYQYKPSEWEPNKQIQNLSKQAFVEGQEAGYKAAQQKEFEDRMNKLRTAVEKEIKRREEGGTSNPLGNSSNSSDSPLGYGDKSSSDNDSSRPIIAVDLTMGYVTFPTFSHEM